MQKTIELNIQSFQGNKAILIFNDDVMSKIEWPINKLPSSMKEGESFKMKIFTDDEIELDHKIIARKLLEEMIN